VAIATPESYADMLDRAKAGKYAIPAINVTSSQTLSAALQGFADAESDGIIQVSNGGAAYWSGSSRADRVKGSLALSAYAYTVADLYPGIVALHTDHCPRKLVDTWLKPLLARDIEQARRRVRELSKRYRLEVDPDALVEDLPVGIQQRVEILKSLAHDARYLIFDEPTAVLTPQERDGIIKACSSSMYIYPGLDHGRAGILVTLTAAGEHYRVEADRQAGLLVGRRCGRVEAARAAVDVSQPRRRALYVS